MTIRRKVKLCMIVAISLALATSLVVFYRGQLLRESFREMAFFDQVLKGTSELNYLARGYAFSQNERSKTQWYERHASLDKLLQGAELNRNEDKAAMAKLVLDMAVIKGLFEQVVSNYDSLRSLTGVRREMKLESNERVTAKLMAKGQVIGNDAALLAETSTKKVFVVQRRVFLTILTLSLSMVLVIAFIAFILSRSVVRGLRALTEGAEALSVGDLDHRIVIRHDDEISTVARAFNNMAERLKKNYLDLQKSHNELEKRVEERTRILQERTVQLEAANKELESFSYSVSHDLRAPLRHMSGFVELLKNGIAGSPDEKISHYAEIISASAKKMGTLIDDLLAFSRIGRSEILMQRIDTNEIVKQVVRESADNLNERDIEWKIAQLPDVYGDASMLSLMLTNLIANAVKFTRPCTCATIEIACSSITNGECTFFIKDNGVGFNMKFAAKLFGVFQRLHHEDEFEGTGIGLANVHRIVSRHGGRIWAEGDVGQGAIFYFTLPLAKEEKVCRI